MLDSDWGNDDAAPQHGHAKSKPGVKRAASPHVGATVASESKQLRAVATTKAPPPQKKKKSCISQVGNGNGSRKTPTATAPSPQSGTQGQVAPDHHPGGETKHIRVNAAARAMSPPPHCWGQGRGAPTGCGPGPATLSHLARGHRVFNHGAGHDGAQQYRPQWPFADWSSAAKRTNCGRPSILQNHVPPRVWNDDIATLDAMAAPNCDL